MPEKPSPSALRLIFRNALDILSNKLEFLGFCKFTPETWFCCQKPGGNHATRLLFQIIFAEEMIC